MDHKLSRVQTSLDLSRVQLWMQPEADQLELLAGGYAPIGLEQMEAMALLNRTDTKFLLTARQLQAALAAVQNDYWMLAVGGQRLNHYRTLYFDTPDWALYRAHVNGRADRYKVRSREYTDAGLSFLEVKHKTNQGRTIKARMPTPSPATEITPEVEDWLRGVFPYPGAALEPKVWNTFTRLTLVGKRSCERVTLDVDLTLYTGSQVVQAAGIAVAEVKRDRQEQASPFLAHMRAQRIQPVGFSKYCVAVSQLVDEVKKNALKPRLLRLAKMTHGAIRYD